MIISEPLLQIIFWHHALEIVANIFVAMNLLDRHRLLDSLPIKVNPEMKRDSCQHIYCL